MKARLSEVVGLAFVAGCLVFFGSYGWSYGRIGIINYLRDANDNEIEAILNLHFDETFNGSLPWAAILHSRQRAIRALSAPSRTIEGSSLRCTRGLNKIYDARIDIGVSFGSDRRNLFKEEDWVDEPNSLAASWDLTSAPVRAGDFEGKSRSSRNR